jgi:hypothetical protein
VSEQLRAAIAGGLLSGVVVLIGVLVDQHLTRRREREARIQETTRRLVIETRKLEDLWRKSRAEVDQDRLDELDDRVESLALELRLLSLNRRRYRGLIRAIDDLIVNQIVAREQRSEGQVMSMLETLGSGAISDSVFPPTTGLIERVRHRAASGLPTLRLSDDGDGRSEIAGPGHGRTDAVRSSTSTSDSASATPS